jgi:hypothetical protein
MWLNKSKRKGSGRLILRVNISNKEIKKEAYRKGKFFKEKILTRPFNKIKVLSMKITLLIKI